jgi:DNA polymerase elongation subunit (family B)
MKYEYKGEGKKYDAVKRIANSLYGVFGDSNSYGVGFRLFDWRLAETITVAGRKVLQHTADEFTQQLKNMGYKDAQLIGGDTDSVMTTIPSADDREETLEASFKAANAVNASYDDFMCEEFDICDPSGHKMEVEIESYADAIFFLQNLDSDDPTDGVKKKYSQLVTWDEGEYIDDPEPKSKGFKLVRSDTAAVTGEVQTGVLHRILREDEPKDAVEEFLKEKYDDALDGNMPTEDIGIPSSISSDPMDYGWSEDDETGEIKYFTPQPHIRGARYASAYIKGEDITSGSKPLMFYVKGVRASGDLPETYDYENLFELNAPKDKPDANKREMKELDRAVDAIAVEDVRNIPSSIDIDWEKMAEKTIEDSVNNIAVTMGWHFSDLVNDGSQSGLADFM